MPKFYKIEGRVAITGNPITDAKLLGKFQVEYDALAGKFIEAGGSLDMRIMTEKEKSPGAVVIPAAPPAPEANMPAPGDPLVVASDASGDAADKAQVRTHPRRHAAE